MRREQLEHLIRAACAILAVDDVVVIGSQAILGSYDDRVLADVALQSMEADLLPVQDPDGRRADLIDGAIGEASLFHETFGVYGQGVERSTALLSPGWSDRLVPLTDRHTGVAVGWCLDVHDLCASKLLANRPKDLAFVRAVIEARLADPDEVLRLIHATTADEQRRAVAAAHMGELRAADRPASDRAGWWRRRRQALADRHRIAPRSAPDYGIEDAG